MRKIIITLVVISAFGLSAGAVHAQAVPVASPLPTHISIPEIAVQADIIPVDVTASNNLGVPPNFVQAGWYDHSALPGSTGTEVIDGHVDNGGAVPGVFKNLSNIGVGGDIYISTVGGGMAHYKVTSLAVYTVDAFPSAQVFANTDSALLNIITCYGTFLPKQGTYDKRLIVTATLVS